MDYKELYTEALERAGKELEEYVHKDCDDMTRRTATTIIHNLFPELKEPEDENKRISKEISQFLKQNNGWNNEWLTWLEKQDVQRQSWKPSIAQRIVIQELIEDKNISNAHKTILRGMFDEFKQLINNHKKEIDDAYLQGICDAKHEIEKQREKDPCIGCTNDKGCVTCENGNMKETKPEPKFHPGDWIVDKSGLVQQVIDFRGGIYTCTYNSFTIDCESNYHLWTIADAKNGDVLCTYECDEPKIVFILKGAPKKHYALSYHCYYNIMYPYFDSDSENGCLAPKDENVKPATKEQRDLLFQKMKEAGYEWDNEKKCLN